MPDLDEWDRGTCRARTRDNVGNPRLPSCATTSGLLAFYPRARKHVRCCRCRDDIRDTGVLLQGLKVSPLEPLRVYHATLSKGFDIQTSKLRRALVDTPARLVVLPPTAFASPRDIVGRRRH